MNKRVSKVFVLMMAVGLTSAAAGCGSDGTSEGATPTTSPAKTTTTATADDEKTTTTVAGDETADEVKVIASDYKFEGVPKSVPVGTKLVLQNDSEEELHEMVVIKFPDDEERSIDEVAKLSEAEQDAIFGDAMPAAVQLQAPGGEVIPAVGDGTLAEPGRYAIVCFIPVGVDPQEYLDASQANPDGPPEIPNAGPPHFMKGMYTEVTVE
ncbi:MAG: hypothetical protein JWO77_989 [Ilumatobacteraceae bacterium]|nr:hypothetical protein [Ilumatobacteraceae bacterium]